MSERTTIGGTVYETVGSSTSNLLLKCNGTARILWGNKLIDLIKNGKIASSDSLLMIFTISDEADIKSDGIYILTTEELDKLLLSKDGNIYNLTEFDLYISASKQQDLTVDLKNQALFNIGMFYDTLDDVKKANIKNGVVYVIKEKAFYTIRDSIIEEFEAKIKTVEVEKLETEETINSSVKITLSVADKEYLILADERITANYSIHVKESAQLGSESANQSHGYRLYMEGGTSYLDVDEINVRNGLPSLEYKEITHELLITLIQFKTLKPHQWYLITDFQNHWKLPTHNLDFNRPILIRALTNSTFYEEGELFKDRRVKIHYDPFFQETINQLVVDKVNDKISRIDIKTRGLITWMKDALGNEANFDFLDYKDDKGNPLALLHKSVEDPDYLDESIFPKNSYNNKLTIQKSKKVDGTEYLNLYGTVIGNVDIVWEKEEITIQGIVNDNTHIVEILFDDTKDENRMTMHDNSIECFGLTIPEECLYFYNNTIKYDSTLSEGQNEGKNLYFKINNEPTYITNCTFINVCESIIEGNIDSCLFFNVYNSYIHTKDENKIKNSTFKNIHKYKINGSISDSYFNSVKFTESESKSEFKFTFEWKPETERYELTLTLPEKALISSSISKSNIFHCQGLCFFLSSCILQTISIGNENIKNQISTNYSFELGTYENSQFNVLNNCTFNIVNSKTFSGNTFDKVENVYFMNQTITNSTINTLSNILKENNPTFTINNCTFESINWTFLESSDSVNSFDSSIFGNVSGSTFENAIFTSSTFGDISGSTFKNTSFTNSTFGKVSGSTFNNVKFDFNTFGNIYECSFNVKSDIILNFRKTSFKNLLNVIFENSNEKDTLTDITAHNDITPEKSKALTINPSKYPILFDITKTKEVYYSGGTLSVTIIKEGTFFRGMIIMYDGTSGIPAGWAICDGSKHLYDGVTTTTPDLRGRFIKANFIESIESTESGEYPNYAKEGGHSDITNYNIGVYNVNENNQITLSQENLPKHEHLYKDHSHSISNNNITLDSDILNLAEGDEILVPKYENPGGEGEGEGEGDSNYHTIQLYKKGDEPSFTINNFPEQTGDSNLEEASELSLSDTPKALNIEPNYYSLIFIIKL